MNDRNYQPYAQPGHAPPPAGGMAQFHAPVAVPLRTPGALTPLRAPYALSVHVAPQLVAAAAAMVAPAQQPPPQAQPQPGYGGLPFGGQGGYAPPQPGYPQAPAPGGYPAPPAPLGGHEAAQGAVPAPPAMVTPPAMVDGQLAPPAMVTPGATPPPAVSPLSALAFAALTHGPGGPADGAAPPSPQHVDASAPAAPPVEARATSAEAGPEHAAVGGPPGSPWAIANERVQQDALPSAQLVTRVHEDEKPAAAPAPAKPSSSRGTVVLLVLVLLVAGGALAFVALRHKAFSDDPISIGVKEDGSRADAPSEEPSATPTATATVTAAPKAVAPKPKPRDDDIYNDGQKKPAPKQSPGQSGGPKYNPTDL